jgi:hypothetical protein
MDTDKEITAFVDRITKRQNDNPKASQRGRHRAAFIALRPAVEYALSRGHTLKAIWETLRDEHKASMTYETFRNYCRRAGLGQGTGGDVVARAAPSALIPAASATPPARPQQPDETRPRGFQHERVPRKKDIYG